MRTSVPPSARLSMRSRPPWASTIAMLDGALPSLDETKALIDVVVGRSWAPPASSRLSDRGASRRPGGMAQVPPSAEASE
jgi:hypothetical protein